MTTAVDLAYLSAASLICLLVSYVCTGRPDVTKVTSGTQRPPHLETKLRSHLRTVSEVPGGVGVGIRIAISQH